MTEHATLNESLIAFKRVVTRRCGIIWKVAAPPGVVVAVAAAEAAGAARAFSVQASPPRITIQDCRA